MSYTLGQAAKATGKAKSTIQRAIDKGRISAEKNDIGQYNIEPSELHRVYPPVAQQPIAKTVASDSTHPQQQSIKINTLEVEVKLLYERVEDKNKIIEDLRTDRNDWKHQAQKLLLENIPQNVTESRALKNPILKPVQNDNNNLGSSGRGKGNNALHTSFMFVFALFLTSLLTYVTKSFWLPFIN